MNAGMLNCPHCGAAVNQDSRHCAYCQGLLQTVACSKCMAMMFAGADFCPTCGARTEVVTAQDQSAHQCPRCAVPGRMLQHVALGQSLVEECPQCSGMWIDARRFDRMCADAQAQAVGSTTPDGSAAQLPHVTPERQIQYIRCPVCAEIMNRTNFDMQSGVVIDVCKGHGIWLDKDELRQIIAFIRAGGINETRAMQAQKALEERLAMISQEEIKTVRRAYGTGQSLAANEGTGLLETILSVAWDAVFGKL
jgi:Zn-finger nucleic acid-binding protein